MAARSVVSVLATACVLGGGASTRPSGGAAASAPTDSSSHPPSHGHGASSASTTEGAAEASSHAAHSGDDGHDGRDGHHAHGGHQHRFQGAAHWAQVFDDPARDAWQKPALIVAAMELRPGATVADVGAGTGYFEPYLSRAVGSNGAVIAVDVEPDMVAWLQARVGREGLANVRVGQAQPSDPGLPGHVDRVLVVDTWHHIEGRVAYARTLASTLNPGGSVWVVDFTKTSPMGPPPAARLSAEEVAAELQAAGLAPRRVALDLPYQYVVVGERSGR